MYHGEGRSMHVHVDHDVQSATCRKLVGQLLATSATGLEMTASERLSGRPGTGARRRVLHVELRF